jgi:hypothetical protein
LPKLAENLSLDGISVASGDCAGEERRGSRLEREIERKIKMQNLKKKNQKKKKLN